MWRDYLKNRDVLILNVKPAKQKTEILEERNGVIIMTVNAPPQDGKANSEIQQYFKKLLKRNATITSGFQSKKKMLKLS